MKKIVVAIPHSHAWFWLQTCVSSLMRNPPRADGYEVEVVVVDNSPWSPAIRGVSVLCKTPFSIEDAPLSVLDNHKTNKFHASALDCVVEKFDFDYLMALETDVLALRPSWLQWFVDQLKPTDYSVGAWHHEQFVNPSCTLYRGNVLRDMMRWCKKGAPQDELRWGTEFEKATLLDANIAPEIPGDSTTLQHLATLTQKQRDVLTDFKGWIGGPFAEKRGWPSGTKLKQPSSGQCKGPGWYEPGQQLHHWAVEAGHTYTVCSTMTTHREAGLPIQTLYGSTMPDPQRQLEAVELFGNAETVHLWGGTRALDILKHPVTCEFVKKNTPDWLNREARFWRGVVPLDVQAQTLELIRKHGWHITGQGTDHVTERDKEASEYVRSCYKGAGVEW